MVHEVLGPGLVTKAMATAPMSQPSNQAPLLVLFDGECPVCVGSVKWILRRDPAGIFHFSSLQAPWVGSYLALQGLPPRPETLVLINHPTVFLRSEAVRQVALRLPGWSCWLGHLVRMVPLVLRDGAYRLFARWRQLFSRQWRRTDCVLPTGLLGARFHVGTDPPSWLLRPSELANSPWPTSEIIVPCK
jgi:predicted DCC family thiol-disulfide oxidoreductase YuxK